MDEIKVLKELQKGLVAWYDFVPDSSILYIGKEDDAIPEYLRDMSEHRSDGTTGGAAYKLSVTVLSLEEIPYIKRDDVTGIIDSNKNKFDYVICIGLAERVSDPAAFMRCLEVISTPDAIFLFGFNNRLGMRYFCGDRDPYTGRSFDGLEGYRRHSGIETEKAGRMYDKSQIKRILYDCGVYGMKFYSVLSDLDNPILMIAEGYTPNEDLATRIYPVYRHPETVFLEEELLYETLINNDILHQMADAYLVEFSFEGSAALSDALQITATTVRNHKDSMLTVIHADHTVEKINVYPEGRERLENMIGYAIDLKEHGLKVVDMELTDRGLKMPYIDAPVGQMYLKKLYLNDREEFFKAMDHFRDLILRSSEPPEECLDLSNDEEVTSNDTGVVLKNGYIDLVPLNSFYIDGDFVFFDQEFIEENYPANAIIARMISTFYAGNSVPQTIMTRDEMYARYGLYPRIDEWRAYEKNFLDKLRNDDILKDYYSRVRKNRAQIEENRRRINRGADYERRTFVDVFEKTEGKRLFIFGSGRYAEIFLQSYSDEYPFDGIVDNDRSRWGERIKIDEESELEILSPEELRQYDRDKIKVFVCIKKYGPVVRQLEDMGIMSYSVYDPIRIRKKYRVGYVAGVFDLFHMGHLNLLRRAKEQCNHLIVGVVTDEQMRRMKKRDAHIPFNDRIAIVRACRYVDEAHAIPPDRPASWDAWELYHFDAQFSGDDHDGNAYWKKQEDFLREHGSQMVYFPYTRSVNSTKLRALVEDNSAEK